VGWQWQASLNVTLYQALFDYYALLDCQTVGDDVAYAVSGPDDPDPQEHGFGRPFYSEMPVADGHLTWKNRSVWERLLRAMTNHVWHFGTID
jgi:hypothetical protein